ncbi:MULTISPECIES: sporulation membrane protein YtrI [unclassified Bacillus (in: firmicutes)]|uniref:sporulation membrane protein YtrI n=1 Tax=unclassified Bacillus (in: firmicutes) TaxID=185979 RepID=UPI000BF1664E|nr:MULTISPECIES: sporulation membrane protein YtrI [unclassified Bacillus (in: firmicutes)]PEJ57872.1 molybdenum cofactor biosynthesis protein MoaA [Bacillus sp. AFS002410]PEL12558.1 molybdenum cofactor biosynthesis protein MoaA [Bacillus sp. AFS017336]
MKAPPERLSHAWAKFFVGIFFGFIISWLVFIYMYGVTEEEQVKQISELKMLNNEYLRDKNILIENTERLNKENKRNLTVQEIKVTILNSKQYNLNLFTQNQIISDVKNDLSHLLTQDIKSVSQNRELLRRAIENKVYIKDDRRFKLEIDTIYFDTVLEITLKIKSTK